MNLKLLGILLFILFVFGGCREPKSAAGVDQENANKAGGVDKDDIAGSNPSPKPGNSGTINASNPDQDNILLEWTYATDTDTPQEELLYLVYYSDDSTKVKGVGTMETRATAWGDYEANITSKTINGLTAGGDYYFNVIVYEDGQNKVAYQKVKASLPLKVPIPGNNGQLASTDLTGVSVTLNWTAATDNNTPQSDLEYKVFYSTSNNISSISDCEVNGTAFGDYTANISTIQITGLLPTTLYYFNVIVRESEGLKSAYNYTRNTTGVDDPPIAGGLGIISSDYRGSIKINICWESAYDDNTLEPDLEYLVYYSLSNNISTLNLCETNGTPVGTFAVNINNKMVEGLSAFGAYWFNVVVRDQGGNKDIYQMQLFFARSWDHPPKSGNDGLIEFGNVTGSTVALNWTKATDIESLPTNLEYIVYYSTFTHLKTVFDCETNGTAFGTYTKDISTQTVTGLSPETPYNFNIVVKDQGDNKTCYEPHDTITDKALAIGGLHEGGIVIYLDGSGGGLVCALTDQSTSAEWGCYNTALAGCEDQSIGSGQANTTAIIAGCSTAGIAARICDDYNDGTYSDWFLPSFNEGKEIQNNLTAINNGLAANSGTTFSGKYWTSTQASWDQKGVRPDRKLDAWIIFGTMSPYQDKNTSLRVRAVRKF